MVARGKFFLYDSIVPALEAGSYTLNANIELTSGDSTSLPVNELNTHFNVTAPRFKLPPDQVLMTFPPANSEGAYEDRLPQIVLKKKTLPWDRRAAPAQTKVRNQVVQENTPWLALVVIAEGEGQILHDQPWEECTTEGIELEGLIDTPRASYLSVPQSTVDRIFPTVEDLALLTHVREVNPDDTEAAMGDDDGFLAVVIANRTPQFDTANCRPRTFTACLINLEKQLGVLPARTPPRDFFDLDDLYLTDEMVAVAASVRSGTPVPLSVGTDPRELDINNSTVILDAVRRGEVVFHDGLLVDRVGASPDGVNVLGRLDESDFLSADFSGLAREASASDDAPILRVKGTFAAFDFPLFEILAEEFYRFPVLTSWRFTCSGAGSFEKLMSSLDVGLLGTVAEGGYKRPLPACSPTVEGEDPGSPITQLPLEVADTGHVGLPHLTRTGETTDAWYRGPFSPHQLLRNPLADDEPFPVLAHVSDHLRSMTPDGREDVSLAVAFETGRLLAMSQPSFVAALQRWRAERFGAARARISQRSAFFDRRHFLDGLMAGPDLDRFLEVIEFGELPLFLESGLVGMLEQRKEQLISAPRELVNPGAQVDALRGDFNAFLADGLGIARGVIDRVAAQPAAMGTLGVLQAAEPGQVSNQEINLNNRTVGIIDTALNDGIRDLADIAVGGKDIKLETLRELETFENLDSFVKDRFERD